MRGKLGRNSEPIQAHFLAACLLIGRHQVGYGARGLQHRREGNQLSLP